MELNRQKPSFKAGRFGANVAGRHKEIVMKETLCGYSDKGVLVTPAQITAIHRELPWLHKYVPDYVSVRVQRADLGVFRSEPARIHYSYDGEWVYERVFLFAQNGALLCEVGKYKHLPLWRCILGFLNSDLLRKEETVDGALKNLLASEGCRFVDQQPVYIVASYLWADGGCATVHKPKKPATSLFEGLQIALEQERQVFEAEVARAKHQLELDEALELEYVI